MKQPPEPCPSLDELTTLLSDSAIPTRQALLEHHLSKCPKCQEKLENIAGGKTWNQTRPYLDDSPFEPVPSLLKEKKQADQSPQPNHPKSVPLKLNEKLPFLTSPSPTDPLGTFGPYTLHSIIGQGGMGIVFKAHDPSLNRWVAIKILPQPYANRPLSRARFIREARTAAAALHEHIIPIFAIDEFQGHPYLTMPLIQGGSLAERLHQNGPLPLSSFFPMAIQIADGLAAAHELDIVHRDIKPSNILLESPNDRVKIVDFGLARALYDSSITEEGLAAGTPSSMSPEQAKGSPVTARSDLFSFGCLLYESLTGIPPFHADHPLAALHRVCQEIPKPPRHLNPSIPPELETLILQLLEKNPENRPHSAKQVSATLQTQSQSKPLPPVNASSQWPVIKTFLTTFGILALTSIFVVYAFSTRPVPTPSLTLPTVPPNNSPQPISTNAFHLFNGNGSQLGNYPTLQRALESAPADSIVEIHHDGPLELDTIDLRGKKLRLRASLHTTPILIPKNPFQPILTTDSPLVLEGLSFLREVSPQLARRPEQQTGFINAWGGFLHASHCRFTIISARNSPGIVAILMNGAQIAWLQYCHFSAANNSLFNREFFPYQSPSPNQKFSIYLHQNLIHSQNLLVLDDGNARWQNQIFLHKNSLQVQNIAPIHTSVIKPGIHFYWTYNLMHFESNPFVRIISRFKNQPETIPHLHERHNVYLGQQFTHDDSSQSLEPRLNHSDSTNPESTINAFTLTQEELESLRQQGWTQTAPPGADPLLVGPGFPYQKWRQSDQYPGWFKFQHPPEIPVHPSP